MIQTFENYEVEKLAKNTRQLVSHCLDVRRSSHEAKYEACAPFKVNFIEQWVKNLMMEIKLWIDFWSYPSTKSI